MAYSKTFILNFATESSEAARRRFVAFSSTHPVRSRLPEALWNAATELARRYGLHWMARVLHLDYTGLKKRVLPQNQPERETPAVTFVELTGGPSPTMGCRLEVEAAAGKFRVEGGALSTADVASLLRTFLGQSGYAADHPADADSGSARAGPGKRAEGPAEGCGLWETGAGGNGDVSLPDPDGPSSARSHSASTEERSADGL